MKPIFYSKMKVKIHYLQGGMIPPEREKKFLFLKQKLWCITSLYSILGIKDSETNTWKCRSLHFYAPRLGKWKILQKFPILEERNILWTGEKWRNKNVEVGENELLGASWVWILSSIFLALFHRKHNGSLESWGGWTQEQRHVAARVEALRVRAAETKWINKSVVPPESVWTHCGVERPWRAGKDWGWEELGGREDKVVGWHH